MRSLYFSHSYAPEDRRFNEHIWKLLMRNGFHALIDTGLDGGWQGKQRPMEISFNEWMLSRCAGFVAVVPRRESPYQALEYHLALRMGLPSLVVMQEGGGLGAIYTDAHEIPSSWQRFWQEETQDKLERVIEKFTASVEIHIQARTDLSSVGSWRPRVTGGNLRVALLQPSEFAKEWSDVQMQLQKQTPHRWNIFLPGNFLHAHDLILETSQKIDLLVLDVGPMGTPREMVGYLDGLGIPQFRVCKVQNQLEADLLGKYLSGKPRLPYRWHKDPKTLPLFLDGLKLDEYMEPVFFWQSWPELAKRLASLTDRIEAFRSGLTPEEGGTTIGLDTHEAARRYFSQRHKQIEQGKVFLSFAGNAGATGLADRLAPILRFLDYRCFHYRDPDSNTDGRLESGELVKDGLELRVDEADVIVLLFDQAYLDSSYCRTEMQQAAELHAQGRLEMRAYAIRSGLELPAELNDINIFVHRGKWSDGELKEKIIEDIQRSMDVNRCPLRDEEKRQLSEWLTEDGANTPEQVQRLLEQSGVAKSELNACWRRLKTDHLCRLKIDQGI